MKKCILIFSAVLILLTGCGTESEKNKNFGSQNSVGNSTETTDPGKTENDDSDTDSLKVCFGDAGSEFSMHLYDN